MKSWKSLVALTAPVLPFSTSASGPERLGMRLMRFGKFIGHNTQTVSKDSKTGTQDETRTIASGQSIHFVALYDRQ